MNTQAVRMLVAVVMAGGLVGGVPSAQAAEHGGHEHGGAEHGGAPMTSAAPSAEQIRQAIRDYETQLEAAHGGAMPVKDEVTGTTRSLRLERVHERVGKTGGNYYACADMRDTASGDLVDVDFDVAASGSQLSVTDVRIHKVNGQPRYTYDDHDNRVPL